MKCWRSATREFQKKCLGKMGEVARAGPNGTVRQPQHDGVRALCNRVIILENGRIRQDSRDPAAAIAAYAHSDTAGSDGIARAIPVKGVLPCGSSGSSAD